MLSAQFQSTIKYEIYVSRLNTLVNTQVSIVPVPILGSTAYIHPLADYGDIFVGVRGKLSALCSSTAGSNSYVELIRDSDSTVIETLSVSTGGINNYQMVESANYFTLTPQETYSLRIYSDTLLSSASVKLAQLLVQLTLQ